MVQVTSPNLQTKHKHYYRKPYFLALKRFLASEDVTPDDSNPKCKVYPPGPSCLLL
jgi:hypothetical protein